MPLVTRDSRGRPAHIADWSETEKMLTNDPMADRIKAIGELGDIAALGPVMAGGLAISGERGYIQHDAISTLRCRRSRSIWRPRPTQPGVLCCV